MAKKQNETGITINQTTPISDRYDLLANIIEVKSPNLNNKITSDFLYAKLTDDERTFIRKMIDSARLLKRIMENTRRKIEIRIEEAKELIKQKRTDKNIGKEYYAKLEKQKKLIKKVEDKCIDILIEGVYMIPILRRNEPGNWLVELLIKGTNTEEKQTEIAEETGLKGLVKRIFNNAMNNKEE